MDSRQLANPNTEPNAPESDLADAASQLVSTATDTSIIEEISTVDDSPAIEAISAVSDAHKNNELEKTPLAADKESKNSDDNVEIDLYQPTNTEEEENDPIAASNKISADLNSVLSWWKYVFIFHNKKSKSQVIEPLKYASYLVPDSSSLNVTQGIYLLCQQSGKAFCTNPEDVQKIKYLTLNYALKFQEAYRQEAAYLIKEINKNQPQVTALNAKSRLTRREEAQLNSANTRIATCRAKLKKLNKAARTVGIFTEKTLKHTNTEVKENEKNIKSRLTHVDIEHLNDAEKELSNPKLSNIIKGILGVAGLVIGTGLISLGILAALTVTAKCPPAAFWGISLGVKLIKLGSLTIAGSVATIGAACGTAGLGLFAFGGGAALTVKALAASTPKDYIQLIKENNSYLSR